MRPRTLTALLVATPVVALLALYLVRNPERAVLDDAARTAAPGQFVQLSGGITHYEIAGPDTGRVVLLVHGFSVPAYIWDSTSVALAAAGYRVIRYDLFGRGWSDRPDAAYDGPFFDAQIRDLLDSLGVRAPVDLIGLSFGGFVAPHFAASHPERVRRIVLIDPVTTPSTIPWFIKAPVIGPYVFQILAVPGMADGQPGDFLHAEQFPGWADKYRPQMRYRGFGRALRRSRIAMGSGDFDAYYAAINGNGIPALLVWGRQDRVVDISGAETVRRGIPGLEFFPVDSAGHLPHMERSAQVHARIVAFLAR
jgi:pimeloyl-ACP methyl ester carboxylesterase